MKKDTCVPFIAALFTIASWNSNTLATWYQELTHLKRPWCWERLRAGGEGMVGWHHWLNGHGFGQTLGVGDGQGGLACCGSWGHKESGTTEWLNWAELRTWTQPRRPSTDEWIKKLWYIYTVEYYSSIKRNGFESVLMRWMNLEPIIQSGVSQKEKDEYRILMHVYRI